MALRGSAVRIRLAPLLTLQATSELFVSGCIQPPPSECLHSVSIPAFCAIAQGSKEVLLGSDRYQYDPMHYLLATVELPIVSQILEASRAQPYFSLRLDLDPTLVGSVMVEAGYSSSRSRADVKAIDLTSSHRQIQGNA